MVLIIGLFGAANLTLEAFGYSIITDDQINAFENAVAAAATVVAAYLRRKSER